MIVKVTAEHIAKGERNDPWQCPISLALKEAGFFSPRVCRDVVLYNKIDDQTQLPLMAGLPLRAQVFVLVFDKSGLGAPFEFEVDLGRS